MNNPKVSVLIPAYNYASYISEAIESVLNQTYENYELIIVDNNSSDNTVEIVNNYIQIDNRIKLYVNKENIGMYRNYNQALLKANGDYIKFLNADDKFESTLLEKFVNILDSYPNVSLVSSDRQYFGDKSDVLESGFNGLQEGKKIIFESLKNGNFIGEPSTVMFRKSNLNLGLFDSSLLMFADWDMWLRQLSTGDIYFIKEVLSYFRIHNNQGTKYLNADLDKGLFNNLQNKFYVITALTFNRYKYDYLEFDEKEYKKLINYNYSKIVKNYWKSKYWYNRLPNIFNLKSIFKYFEGILKRIIGYYKW